MALTIHQLALRLGRHIGVTAFDPGDVSNTNPLMLAGARMGDLDEVVVCINGALQELWTFAPRGVRELYPDQCPVVTAADVGTVSDPGRTVLLLPEGWEESVLYPLALRRLSAHPDFQPLSAKAEIERQAALALRMILFAADGGRPEAVTIGTQFR